MHQIQFRLGLRPRPRWGSLQRSHTPLDGFKGPTSKGREGEEGKGGEGSGRDRRGGKGRRERGKSGGAIQFLASGRHKLSYVTDKNSRINR